MAITLATPVVGYAAESDGAVKSTQDITDANEADQQESSTESAADETDVGEAEQTPENEEPENDAETPAEVADEEAPVAQTVPYADRLSEVSELLKTQEFTEETETFVTAFDGFCTDHSSKYDSLESFLDEYFKTVKKTADKITVIKTFGSIYQEDMDDYISNYIRSVIENSSAEDSEKEVYLSLLELGGSQEDFWSYYDEWVKTYPEPENNASFSDSTSPSEPGNDNDGDENNGDNNGTDGTGEGDNNSEQPSEPDGSKNEEKPEPPSNAAYAEEELRKLDYSSLSEDMQLEAKKLIDAAIEKVWTCTTEEEVTAVVEETKAQLQELIEKDLQNIRIEVTINELTQFKNSLTFVSDNDRLDAEEAYVTYVDLLRKTTTETELTEIVEQAKTQLQEIADGTGEVLDTAKKEALSDLSDLKDSITDTEIASRTYALWAEKIDSCTTKVDVEKYHSGGAESLTKLKEATSAANPQYYSVFLDSLKLICSEDDTTLLEYIQPKLNEENQVSMISDFLLALEHKDIDSYKVKLLEELDRIAERIPDNLTGQADKIKTDAADAMARTTDKVGAYEAYEKAVQDFKELNASGEELEKKIAENLEALEKLTSLDTKEAKEIVRVYKEKISAAKTIEEADSLLKEAEEKLKKLEAADEDAKKLTQAKESAYKQLDTFLNGITDTSLKSDIQKVISSYRSDIAIADTVEEIDRLLDDAKKEIEGIKKKHEDETTLKKAKEKAVAQIDNFLKSVKDADLKTQLEKLADSAKNDVDNATDSQTINSILTKFKEDATKLTKEYTADKALASKKTSTVKKITDFTNGKEMTNEMYNLYMKAKNDVMEAKTSSEIDAIYNTFVKAFNEKAMASLRKEYEQKLNDLLQSVDTSSPKYNEITAVISKARDNIGNATSEVLMQNIYSQAKANVETLIQQGDTQDDLDTIKANAIEELRSSTSLTTSTAQKVISVYSNKIQNATSESEVEKALGEGKALLQKLNEAAGLDPDGTDDNGTQTNGSTMNKADGGADNVTAYSSTKKEDMGSGLKGGVKTGDENGLTIIVSITALLAGIGAIGVLLWKKLKK